MKLYVVLISIDYEGSITKGIFDTREKAQVCLDKWKDSGDKQYIFETNLNEEKEYY